MGSDVVSSFRIRITVFCKIRQKFKSKKTATDVIMRVEVNEKLSKEFCSSNDLYSKHPFIILLTILDLLP